MNHSGRKPACCWEKLQDVSTTFISQTRVDLSAKLGIEVEGVGTRFVTRTFSLVKDGGVWKIPEADVISLAEPNMQRITKGDSLPDPLTPCETPPSVSACRAPPR